MSKGKLYIAYGSNLNLEQMKHRCPTATRIGTSVLENYRLRFRGWNHHAVATVEPAEGHRVPVLLWQILPEDEAALDMYEGYPNMYRKEVMAVELNNENVEAMIYVLEKNLPYDTPAKDYFKTIAKGYEAAGFPFHPLCSAAYGKGGNLHDEHDS